MARTFNEMKKEAAAGKTLEQLASTVRYNLGTHKRTRLKKAGVTRYYVHLADWGAVGHVTAKFGN